MRPRYRRSRLAVQPPHPRACRSVSPPACRPKLGDFGLRLIGTTDIDGNGTSHEVEQVDPIVLFDFAEFKASGESAFRPHPHFGLTAMSFLPRKGAWMAWDSLKGESEDRLKPGGLYYVHAGSPAFHHEFAAPAHLPTLQLLKQMPVVRYQAESMYELHQYQKYM